MMSRFSTRSRNRMAYFMVHGVDFDFELDEDGTLIGLFEADATTEAINRQYNEDAQLHEFLNKFREIKAMKYELKNKGDKVNPFLI